MSICLCMIVKNESALIREALRSARPYIDKYSIVDTGSTDGTLSIVRDEMKDVPGNIYLREWKNYGESRTEAIEMAKFSGCDWILILDADETLVGEGTNLLGLDPNLAYWMTVEYGNITYARPNLINAKQNWKYVGVTHEYLAADPMPQAALLPILIKTNSTRCTKSMGRCLDDIEVLKKGLLNEPGNGRYVFYLAQSFRDAEKSHEAVTWYRHRANMGGWFEETYYAQFQLAQLMERLKYPKGEIIEAYLRAYDLNPLRSESLGALARYLRLSGDFHSAYFFASKAATMPRPDQILFVDDNYYNWLNKDEFSVSAYWTGRYEESKAASEFLLESGKLPAHEIQRVKDNIAHAENRLAERLCVSS